MHEFSVAQSIVSRILNIAKKHYAREVREVTLVIGELTFINLDQLMFALRTLSKGSVLKSCEFRIKREKIRVKCLKCNYIGRAEYEREKAHSLSLLVLPVILRCPKCGNNEVDVISGREIMIKNVRLVIEESNPAR